MTDPTADAIAALTPFAKIAEQLPDSLRDGAWVATTLHCNDQVTAFSVRRAREVRSALLSAQGQAGKPVATEAAHEAARIAGKIRHGDGRLYDLLPSECADLILAFCAQPQPAAGATDALTAARTALEAAEKAMTAAQRSNWPPAMHTALSLVSSALATIKGLET